MKPCAWSLAQPGRTQPGGSHGSGKKLRSSGRELIASRVGVTKQMDTTNKMLSIITSNHDKQTEAVSLLREEQQQQAESMKTFREGQDQLEKRLALLENKRRGTSTAGQWQ